MLLFIACTFHSLHFQSYGPQANHSDACSGIWSRGIGADEVCGEGVLCCHFVSSVLSVPYIAIAQREADNESVSACVCSSVSTLSV